MPDTLPRWLSPPQGSVTRLTLNSELSALPSPTQRG
jgi:hypothetical protein